MKEQWNLRLYQVSGRMTYTCRRGVIFREIGRPGEHGNIQHAVCNGSTWKQHVSKSVASMKHAIFHGDFSRTPGTEAT